MLGLHYLLILFVKVALMHFDHVNVNLLSTINVPNMTLSLNEN